MGVMPLAEYRSIWYDEPLELAQQRIEEAKMEKMDSISKAESDERDDNNDNPIPP